MPLPAGGGVLVPADVAAELAAEVFAGLAGAELPGAGVVAAAAAGAEAGAGAGFDAGAAEAAAGAGAAEASALAALVFLLLLLVAGAAAAEVVAAGAAEEPGAGAAVESAVFFDRVFFVVAAESLEASGVALASAAVFFDRVFLAVVDESAEAAGVAEESAAAAFEDFVFFALLVASAPLAELSVLAALESAAAFFLDLLFDVPAAVDESSAVVESAAAAFFVFFFVVFVLLSALESLCASCARTCVVKRNRPISAATASMKILVRRIRFMLISLKEIDPFQNFFVSKNNIGRGSSYLAIAVQFASAWVEAKLFLEAALTYSCRRTEFPAILRGLYCGIFTDST
jgi:hypothetical protein